MPIDADHARRAPRCRSMRMGINGALKRPIADTIFHNYAYEMSNRFRSEEHTSELQSLMRISYAVFCLKKKNTTYHTITHSTTKHQMSAQQGEDKHTSTT